MTELPEGWADAGVGELADDVSSGFASGRHNVEAVGVPHLRPMNVSRNGEIDLDNLKYVAPEAGDRRLSFGDVLFNNTNSPVLVGKTAAYLRQNSVTFSNHMTRVRLHEGMNPSFVARQLHYLWTSGGLGHLISNHVNQASIASSRLASDVRLRVAPTAEQERIVTAIEEAFSKLDAGEAGLRTVRQRLKRMREAVLAAAVTGRLVPQDPTDTSATKLLADVGVTSVPDGMYEIPTSWTWARLGSLLREPLRNGMSAVKADVSTGLPTFSITAVTTGDFSERNIKFTAGDWARAEDLWAEPGDLFVQRSNTPELVGTARLYDGAPRAAIFPDLLIRVRTVMQLRPPWLELFMGAPTCRAFVRGQAKGLAGSMPKISQPVLGRLSVAVPPEAEQDRIITEVQRQFSFVEACERAVDAGLMRSAALRRLVLKAAFEGRLVPQDPSDEPASALLERIRAERSALSATAKPPRRRRTVS